MTDIAAPKSAAAARTSASSKQIAKRYAAERRFRAYGMAAIILTALFVVALLADIVWRGLPAFWEHRLMLTINASAEALDPQNTGDPAKIRGGDFDGLVRGALRSALPGVTSRSDRRALNGLLSSGAADDFRNMIVANPALVGKDVQIIALLSDDADQYLKGYQTPTERVAGPSSLTITQDGDRFVLTAENAAFDATLDEIRASVSRGLARDTAELARLDAAVADLQRQLELAEARLADATKAGAEDVITAATAGRDQLAADLQGLLPSRDVIKARVDALQARLDPAAPSQVLDANFPSLLIQAAGGVFRAVELADRVAVAEAILPPGSETSIAAGNWRMIELATPENSRRVGDREIIWLEALRDQGLIEKGFAWRFLTSGDSREAELAGIKGALVGSLLTLAVTLLLCLPLGVGAAIYLEEFAPKNRLTDIIEININNLAAVPSIVFGLLGLAMFLNFFGFPRSAPLVGGLVLALLVLPTIIIASRAALKAVPPSIKEAALGVGASHQQAIFHHVLPLAIPGIMTGTIIGMAHALGETAPLLMIGMVAFIVDVPQGVTDAATALPVQIYLWSDLPEIAFQAKTAAAIIVLLLFLFAMNAAAIIIRKRFERRW